LGSPDSFKTNSHFPLSLKEIIDFSVELARGVYHNESWEAGSLKDPPKGVYQWEKRISLQIGW
jgi:hypothetical protein